MTKVLDTKTGKRVRGSMVDLLNQAIDNLRAVIEWAKYEDGDVAVVETEEKAGISTVAPTNIPRTRATIGDIERSRGELHPHRSSGVGGSANWSAKVGEIIIGNLMRGEGGRFASARNISKMMNLLDDVGITPNMFTSMQGLLAGTGKAISGEIMGQLRAAGLVNDQGVVQGKANDIINAIKTGDPQNLKKILKPSKGGAEKVSAEQRAAAKKEQETKNVAALLKDVLARTKLTEALVNDLVAFFDGKDISSESIDQLVALGLMARDSDGNLFMTTYGKSFVTGMRAGNLRDALNAYSRGINSVADGEAATEDDTTTEKNIATVSKALVERKVIAQEQIDKLFAFDRDDSVSTVDMADLIAMGLANVGVDGDIFMTTRGQQLITRIESGNIRDALDSISRAKQDIQTRRNSAKTIRTENAELLIKDNVITRAQADALIRTWINAGGELDQTVVSELKALGLMTESGLSPYGILVMQSLDNDNIDAALEFITDAAGNGEKQYHGIKQLGNSYFLTWTTNAFKDRENEIFTTDTIEQYLNRVDEKGINEGSYDFWHIPGSEFATIKWQGGIGRFMVEIGQFDDTLVGNSFKAFFDMYPEDHPVMAPYGWGCSHEYAYLPEDRKDGVYEWFDKQKSTVLPLQEAANPFTLSEFGLGEKAMKLSEKQRAGLAIIAQEIGNPDLMTEIERVGDERTRILEKSGFEYKAKRVCKTEDGVCYPASDFAFVPDAEKPSTWKLRLAEGEPGNVTVAQLGRAAAAFSNGGFRGNRVELPSGQTGSVKRKIRAQYNKLGVASEDVPESLKMLKEEIMNRKEIALKMSAMSEEMPTDIKEKWDMAAGMVEDVTSEADAIQRMIMEMLVDLPEDTRAQAEELVMALTQLATPEAETVEPEVEEQVVEEVQTEPVETESTMEESTEEEIVPVEDENEEEVTVESGGETKSLSEQAIKSVVEALHLEQLSGLLEQQATALKNQMDAMDELINKYKVVDERLDAIESAVKGIGALETQVAEAKEEVSTVKQQTQVIVEEKQRWIPFWANGIARGSVAREDELTQAEVKTYRKPEVPNVIVGIRNRVLNN